MDPRGLFSADENVAPAREERAEGASVQEEAVKKSERALGSMKTYSDFGKTAKKLLGDDHITGKKVEVKTTSGNGIGFTATGSENASDGSIGGDLTWKYNVGNIKFTSKVLLCSAITTEAVMDKLKVRGLKAVLNGSVAPESYTATSKIELVRDSFAFTLLANMPGNTVSKSLTIGLNDIAVGGEVTYAPVTNSVTNYSLGATIVQKDSELSLTTNKLESYKVAFAHNVSEGFSIGAEAFYGQVEKDVKMTTGVKFAVRDWADLKAKVSNDGLVSFAYKARIDKVSSVTLCTQANLKAMEKGQTIGLALSLDQA